MGEKRKKRRVSITLLRRISQVVFLLFILYGGLLGITKLGQSNDDDVIDNVTTTAWNENLAKDPRLNLYLPSRSCKNTDKELGVFQGCGMFMMSETLQYRSFLAFAIPIFVLVLLSVLFGRVWCGWACPMGFFQELADRLRSFFKINYLRLSSRVNTFLRTFRYAWLAVILLVSFTIALPVFAVIRKDLQNINCMTCPTRYALMFFPGVDPTFMSFKTPFYTVSSIILITFLIVFISSLFIRHFWCRICPNGAFLSLFNKGCFTTKEKDLQKCTKCGICQEVCPLDNEKVYRVKDRKVVNGPDCLMCFECVEKCPETDCLKVKFAGKQVFRSKAKK